MISPTTDLQPDVSDEAVAPDHHERHLALPEYFGEPPQALLAHVGRDNEREAFEEV